MTLVATNLGTYHLGSSPTLVTVYLIIQERDEVAASEVIAAGWLRVSAGTEAVHSQPRAVTRNSLNEIARKLNETIAAAASRRTDAFHAPIVERNRTRASERMLLWRHMLKDKSQNPMRRLGVMVTPAVSERIG